MGKMGMLANHYQALIPYTAGTIHMIPEPEGYVPSNQGRDSGDMELAYSSPRSHQKKLKLLNEKYETLYAWNRRPASFGMSDIGSNIDIYA